MHMREWQALRAVTLCAETPKTVLFLFCDVRGRRRHADAKTQCQSRVQSAWSPPPPKLRCWRPWRHPHAHYLNSPAGGCCKVLTFAGFERRAARTHDAMSGAVSRVLRMGSAASELGAACSAYKGGHFCKKHARCGGTHPTGPSFAVAWSPKVELEGLRERRAAPRRVRDTVHKLWPRWPGDRLASSPAASLSPAGRTRQPAVASGQCQWQCQFEKFIPILET